MKLQPIHLRHTYTIDCYDQEYVDDQTQCYHIAIAALGTIVNVAGHWESWQPLIEGYAVIREKKGFWFEEKRPVRYPAGMDEAEAIIVLGAAFESLARGGYFDGDLCSIPINLHDWLTEKLDSVLAARAETALRMAVNLNNAIASN